MTAVVETCNRKNLTGCLWRPWTVWRAVAPVNNVSGSTESSESGTAPQAPETFTTTTASDDEGEREETMAARTDHDDCASELVGDADDTDSDSDSDSDSADHNNGTDGAYAPVDSVWNPTHIVGTTDKLYFGF